MAAMTIAAVAILIGVVGIVNSVRRAKKHRN